MKNRQKKHPAVYQGALIRKVEKCCYGFLVGDGTALAGLLALLVEFVVLCEAFEFVEVELPDVELVFVTGAGVVTVAGVETLVTLALAGLLALTLTFAESPQAMPRALTPRTAESTITFFILFEDSYLSQRIITCCQAPADGTQPLSCHDSFFSRQTLR
jgi:hypothetical protein